MRLSVIDPSSYSEPEKITTTHISLNWTIDFSTRKVIGCAKYNFKIISMKIERILLDVKNLNIKNIKIVSANTKIPVNFFVSDEVKEVGEKLTIELPTSTSGDLVLQIKYETSPEASALQWLTADQTLGKKNPYLFSQCQAIHARSLLPCQDTPSVKFTYSAIVNHPDNLVALMSALRTVSTAEKTLFKQDIPIPSYLLAIAVGDLVSRPLGPSSNVWAEQDIIEACAAEFSETSDMLKTATEICGPYVWTQYDLLVMPPSFPFGGMENPCLTFVTPTLLAGDKSLADVVAHEIAHSWTGNLVTNKNFEHFWLNEGFTVFIECKIVGRLKGSAEQDFHAIRNLTALKDNMKSQLSGTPELTKLVVDLTNFSPDDAFSSVPYMKGSTFLRYLEDNLGGPTVFEPFLRFYLKKYQFQSVETSDFKSTLYEYFKESNEILQLDKVDWDLWLYGEGLPPIIPKYDDSLALVSNKHAELWAKKTVDELKSILDVETHLTSLQKLDFLSKLLDTSDIVDLNEGKISFLETVYGLKATKNAEILFCFFRLVIRARLFKRLDDIIAFANSNFRMKFVRPIYRDLGIWPEARDIAIRNFESVKSQMMRVCSYGIEKDLSLTK